VRHREHRSSSRDCSFGLMRPVVIVMQVCLPDIAHLRRYRRGWDLDFALYRRVSTVLVLIRGSKCHSIGAFMKICRYTSTLRRFTRCIDIDGRHEANENRFPCSFC